MCKLRNWLAVLMAALALQPPIVTASVPQTMLLTGAGKGSPTAAAGFAYIDGEATALGQNGGTSGTFNSVNANLIACAVASYSSVTVDASHVTDLETNTWTLRETQVATGSRIQLYTAQPTASDTNANHTVTVTQTNAYAAIVCATFSGAHATTFDLVDKGSGGGTTISPTTGITPSVANALVVTLLSGDGAEGAVTTPTNYIIVGNVAYGGSNNFPSSLAYRILGAASAQDPEWTTGNSLDHGTIVASFKPA